jgi:hypothetical protein
MKKLRNYPKNNIHHDAFRSTDKPKEGHEIEWDDKNIDHEKIYTENEYKCAFYTLALVVGVLLGAGAVEFVKFLIRL